MRRFPAGRRLLLYGLTVALTQPRTAQEPVTTSVESDPAQQSALGARRDWPGSLAAGLVLVAATALVSVVLWPGHMNADTVGTFRDADAGHYSDWHSAIWTAIWRALLLFGLRSPGWMFAGGVLIMLVALYLVLRARLSRPLALMAAVAVFAFPPVLSFSIVIGTDGWFAASILCAFGFAIRSARTQGASRAASAVLAVVLAVLAQAARPTAAPAVLPLVGAIAFIVLGPALRSWRRVLAAGTAAAVGTVLIFGAVVSGQTFVLHTPPSHPEQSSYEYDLVALSIAEHQALLPADIYPRQDPAYLQQFATVGGFVDIVPLLWGEHAAIPPIVEGAAFDGLQHAWVTAIRQHPDDYLRHRLNSSLWQLAIPGPELAVYYGPPPPEWFGPMLFRQLDADIVRYTAIGTTGYAAGGPLQLAWVYLLVLVASAAVSIRNARSSDVVLALLSMAILLYTVEVLFLSPGITYRYVYPAVTTGTVLFVLLAASTIGWLWSRTVRLAARSR